MTNSTVRGNTASGNGGGIYAGGDVSVADSTVSENTVQNSGGGIFVDPSFFALISLAGTSTVFDKVPDDCVGVSGC